jgi:hypothetical protein
MQLPRREAYIISTYHATPVFCATCFFCSLDDFWSDNLAVRLGNEAFLHLTRNAFRYQMPEPKADLGDIRSWNGGLKIFVAVMREHCGPTWL